MIGVCSIYKYPKSIIKTIKEVAMMGFRHINIFAYPPHFKEDSKEFVLKVKNTLFEYGLDCSMKIQGYTINLAATNPNLHRKSLDEVEFWLDIAAELNCSFVVLRAGMFFYAERVSKRETYQRLSASLKQIYNKADENGVKILIENYPYPFDIVVHPTDILKLSKIVKMRLSLALNVSHLFDAYKFKIARVERDLLSAIPAIKAVYISRYVNPWDYPHIPPHEEETKYLDFIKHVLSVIKRGGIGVYILVGYNNEEVLDLKTTFSSFLT